MRFELDQEKAWLCHVRHCPSPHWDERPPGVTPNLIVIHGISLPPREFGGNYIDKLFQGRLNPNEHPYFAGIVHLRVSAHVLINRAGEITQYVSFLKRAWHAGQSCFEGREQCNDFSIGIELEGCDDLAYTPAQYSQLIRLIRSLQYHWPDITPYRIVGHSHIAPGRKTDPGEAFDWIRVFQGIFLI
jgi:N-acetyl-anhydromuramoyl-L-alanine amidase